MDEISKVRVKGGFYSESIDINLNENINQRVSIIYGVNGSGKSSLANAIDEYKSEDDDSIKTYEVVELLNADANTLSFVPKEKSNIWVYNEKYQDKNINWNEDSLGAIVMFGEQGEIDKELKEINNTVSEKEKKIESINIEKFLDIKGEFSILATRKSLLNNLKSSWALREKEIKKLTRNAVVKEQFIDEIMDGPIPTSSIIQLKKGYDEKIKDYLSIDDSVEKLNLLVFPNFDLNIVGEISILLNKKLEKPKGNDTEEKLYALIDAGHRNLIDSSYSHFSNSESIECPYCMQKVPKNHKELLLQSIRNVLNEEVQIHLDELEKHKIANIEMDLEYLRKLDNESVSKAMKFVLKCNNEIEMLNKLIENKINNVFMPLENNSDSLIENFNDLLNQLKELQSKINMYNNKVDNLKSMELELIDLNKKIAYFELLDTYERYTDLLKQEKKGKEELGKIQDELKLLDNQIVLLNAKKGQVDIALKDINANLFKIFAGKNRLKLELDENSNYRIISRNKRIKLKKLSAGERNIISLCYFFAHLRNNTNVFEAFSDSYFIVLDDPISSLDFENKIGIYTFLRSQLEHIMVNNKKSRVLILTHDLEVAYKLDKVLDDIRGATQLNNFYCCRRFDINKNTIKVELKKANTYGWNLELIYKYASEEENILENADLYIGNVLRKTLEAYSTFNYKTGISQLTQKDDILHKIHDENLREYYKTRMYRLVLNSDSHNEESAKIFTDHELFEEFDRSERVSVAKDILCILFLLDEEHIKSYFPNNENVISNIRSWITINAS